MENTDEEQRSGDKAAGDEEDTANEGNIPNKEEEIRTEKGAG